MAFAAFSEKTDHKRDGRLCTAKFTATGEGGSAFDVSTTVNVIGHIVQIAINKTSGSDTAFDINLYDTTNNMTILDTAISSSGDITPNNLNSGSGGYCRGILKIEVDAMTSSDVWDITVYYIKM